MFLLRCAFWLFIVYASVIFGAPWKGTPGAQVTHTTAPIGKLAEPGPGADTSIPAMAGVASLCMGHALECADDAIELTALVRAAVAAAPAYVVGAVTEAPRAERTAERGDAAPMPVPDPRRRGRLTKQP